MSKIQDTKEPWNGKTYSEVEEFIKGEFESKAKKAKNPTDGNFAALDSDGNPVDSGYNPGNFLTDHQPLKTINGVTITGEGNIEIPRGKDAVNPFKGWVASAVDLRNLFPEPSIGDYAYVKGETPNDPVSVFECLDEGVWSDSGKVVDTSGVQTFATGQPVNEVGLTDSLKNSQDNEIVKASEIIAMNSRIGDNGFLETRQAVTTISGSYVSAATGELRIAEAWGYAEFNLNNIQRVRFVGLLVKTQSFTSGYAFGYYDNGIWVTVRSYKWDVNPELDTNTVKEYLAVVPSGATHFRTTCASNSVGELAEKFYCFCQRGIPLSQEVDALAVQLCGGTVIHEQVDGKIGNGFCPAWVSVKGSFSTDGSWNPNGYSESKRIDLAPYITAGFNRIKITAGTNYTYYSFSKQIFPSKLLNSEKGEVSPYLSSLNEGQYKINISSNTTVYIDLPSDTDAKYLYFLTSFVSEASNHDPYSVIFEFVESVEDTVGGVKNNQNWIKTAVGYERVIDSVEAINGRDGDFLPWSESKGNINSLSEWQITGASSSYYIDLSPYMAAGFNRIKIFARSGYSAYYSFTKKVLPQDSVLNYVGLTSLVADIGMWINTGGEVDPLFRKRVKPENSPEVVDLPPETDAKYMYFWAVSNNAGTAKGDYAPYSVLFQKVERVSGLLSESVNESESLEIAVNPILPRLKNVRFENGGFVKSESHLTSARIHGDFVCELNDGYRINKVFRVDSNGEIVDTVVTESMPASAIDSSNVAGRRQFYGVGCNPLRYGMVLEITKDDPTELITPKENIYKRFFWRECGNFLSDLETNVRFNADNYIDSEEDSERLYSRASVKSALRRARIAAMIPWKPLRYIMTTSKSWRPVKYKPNSLQIGVPYSRSNPRDKWFGFNVSPYTFLTSLLNPYSVMYTEKIGDKDTYPCASEYGLNSISSYGSGHGVTYYGLVCSAFGSFVYGFNSPLDTDGFPKDTGADGRNYIISVHKKTGNYVNEPVSALTIPALSVITTPGHTYMVVDFLLDTEKNRVAAVVAESTHPNVRVGLYTIDRLQARFNSEYESYCTSDVIEVNVIKPSILHANKETNVWNVGELYPIEPVANGICQPNVKFDDRIMFYMGDKAVVMEYDSNYNRNDRSWLIVKPGAIFKKVKLEKWDKNNNDWASVTELPLSDEVMLQYSDGNLEYYKVDVTEYALTRGKYRASLVNDDYTEETGYTQWIVLNGEIYQDSSDENKIKWSSSNMELPVDDDEYAVAISAAPVLSNNTGIAVRRSYKYATQGYIPAEDFSASYDYIKVDFKCAWGSAMRRVNRSNLQIR